MIEQVAFPAPSGGGGLSGGFILMVLLFLLLVAIIGFQKEAGHGNGRE